MKVRISQRANEQINSALAYVASQSPQGAARIGQKLLDVLQLLADTPEMGRYSDEPGLRRLTLRPYSYLIDYALQGDEIVVLRFRHGARQK